MKRRNFVSTLGSVGLLGALPAWSQAVQAAAGSPCSALDWQQFDDCAACTGRRYRIKGPAGARLELTSVAPGYGKDPRQFVARFSSDTPLPDGIYTLETATERRELYLQSSPADPTRLRAEINLTG